MIIKLKSDLFEPYVHLGIYMGESQSSLRLIGSCTMQAEEWQLFILAMISGSKGLDLKVINEGAQEVMKELAKRNI